MKIQNLDKRDFFFAKSCGIQGHSTKSYFIKAEKVCCPGFAYSGLSNKRSNKCLLFMKNHEFSTGKFEKQIFSYRKFWKIKCFL